MKHLLILIFFFSFTISLSSQENCANAIVLTPGTQQCGNSSGLTGDFPGDGSAPINTCNSDYNDDEPFINYQESRE